MSTLRTTNIIHGSSAISNIVLDNQGRAIFGPDSPAGRAALYVNAQNNRVGVNTESPAVALDVDGAINATGNVAFGGTFSVTGNTTLGGTLTVTGNVIFNGASLDLNSNLDLTGNSTFTGDVEITGDLTVDTDTLFVDASTNCVGIGTSTPSSFNANANHLVIEDSNEVGLTIATTSTGANAKSVIHFANGPIGVASYAGYLAYLHDDDALQFGTNTAEKMRLDSGGRLLVGTTSSVSTNCYLQLLGNPENDAGTEIYLGRRQPATTPLTSGQSIGDIRFGDNSGNVFANIAVEVAGTSGSNDYPGRLIVSLTGDGESSPTERLRIRPNGAVSINTTGGDATLNVRSSAGGYDVAYTTVVEKSWAGVGGTSGNETIINLFSLVNNNSRIAGEFMCCCARAGFNQQRFYKKYMVSMTQYNGSYNGFLTEIESGSSSGFSTIALERVNEIIRFRAVSNTASNGGNISVHFKGLIGNGPIPQ